MLRRATSLAIKSVSFWQTTVRTYKLMRWTCPPCSGKAHHMTCPCLIPRITFRLLFFLVWVCFQILVRHHNLQIMMLDKAQLRLVLPLLALLATFANAQSSIKYVDIGKITLYICWNVTILVQFSWITWTLVLMGLIPPLVRLLVLHFSH